MNDPLVFPKLLNKKVVPRCSYSKRTVGVIVLRDQCNQKGKELEWYKQERTTYSN